MLSYDTRTIKYAKLLADFKSEYTDIDNDGYWNVEEVEGLVDSAISDNNTN